jgi:hypothetical protein
MTLRELVAAYSPSDTRAWRETKSAPKVSWLKDIFISAGPQELKLVGGRMRMQKCWSSCMLHVTLLLVEKQRLDDNKSSNIHSVISEFFNMGSRRCD